MMLNYSPQSCDPALLLRCTVGATRMRLLKVLTDAVHHEISRKTHQHQILIGPRGSGKTHLLSLLAERVRTDGQMAGRILPVQLPEEITASQPADLVARIIERLAVILDHEPALVGAETAAMAALCRARLTAIRGQHNDQEALTLAFDSVDEISAKSGRLIVAIVENFDALLYTGASRGRTTRETPQWALRRELQRRGGMMLIAAAPSSFGEIRDVEAAFHDFFREHDLGELPLDEMVDLMRARLEIEQGSPSLDDRTRRRLQSLKADFSRREPALRAVLTLAGGLPRFGHLLFDVIVETEIGASMQVLSRFLDEQTPYFQSWLNPRLVPERELAVLDYIALSEGPRTPTQISLDLRGFPINAVSMCLKRLLERRLVRREAGGPKDVRYDVAEPLLRVWRRFRAGRGEQDRLMLLAEFVAALFEEAELLMERQLLAESIPDCPRLQLLEYALKRHAAARTQSLHAHEECSHAENAAAEEEFLHGNIQKALLMMESVVASARKNADKEYLIMALGRISHFALLAGDNAAALKAATEGVKLATESGNDLGLAICIQSRGDVLIRLGEMAAAQKAYDAAEALYQNVGSEPGRASCINRRAYMLFRLGENAAARKAYDMAEALHRKVGGTLGLASSIRGRGDVLLRIGENTAAREAYDEAEALFQKVGDELGRANCIESRGDVLFRMGENAAARHAYDEAEALHLKVGNDLGRANCIKSRGDVLFRMGDNAAARQAYDMAEEICQKVGSDLGRANCIRRRGDVLLRMGENTAAREVYDAAEALYRKVGDDLGRANCVKSRGDMLFILCDNAAAREAYDAADELYQKAGSDLGRANCISDRGRALARLGEWRKGLEEVLMALALAIRVEAKVNIPLIMNDYMIILKDDTPAEELRELAGFLAAIPNLNEALAAHENVRSAFSRLAAAVVVKLPGEAAVGAIEAMNRYLSDAHRDLLRPALLAARVRAGTLPANLPAEPEEVRRAVRIVLGEQSNKT